MQGPEVQKTSSIALLYQKPVHYKIRLQYETKVYFKMVAGMRQSICVFLKSAVL